MRGRDPRAPTKIHHPFGQDRYLYSWVWVAISQLEPWMGRPPVPFYAMFFGETYLRRESPPPTVWTDTDLFDCCERILDWLEVGPRD